MTLNIEHPDADRLAHELAAATGESLTEAVLRALRERLARAQEQRQLSGLRDELRAIRERCAQLPILDSRSPDEMLGYDAAGAPH